MSARGPVDAYFNTAQEVEEQLGLPMLGNLEAETRFHQLTGSLAALAPDPRFSERIYRLLGEDTKLIWIAGLGDAGEEIPVGIGIAARAATAGAAPVLLVRPMEKAPSRTDDVAGRPIAEGERFGPTLRLLYPHGCVAQATGIQGVFRTWPDARPEGEVLKPVTLIVAAPGELQPPALAAGQVSQVLLVVPYRDQPRERITAAVAALQAADYRLAGFVTYGSAENRHEEEVQPSGAAPDATRREEEEVVPREEVTVAETWSQSFGPASRRRKADAQKRDGSLSMGRVLLISLLVLVVVAVGLRLVSHWILKSQDQGAGQTPGGDSLQVAVQQPSGTTTDAHQPSPEEVENLVEQDPEIRIQEGETGIPPEDREVAQADRNLETETHDQGAVSAGPGEPEPIQGPAERDVETRPGDAGADDAVEVPVRVVETPKTIEPEQAVQAPETELTDGIHDMVLERAGPYVVVCGSFRSSEGASAERERLTRLDRDARVITVRIPDRGVWHRVVIGLSQHEEMARALAEEVVTSGEVQSAQIVAMEGIGMTIGPPMVPGD